MQRSTRWMIGTLLWHDAAMRGALSLGVPSPHDPMRSTCAVS
jgi:hypothetical protein